MIVLIAVILRLALRQRLVVEARVQADRGLAGSMEGHAAMDMSIRATGSLWRRLSSGEGRTAVAHVFVMEWAAVVRDIVIVLVLARALGAWVPDSFWRHLFLTGHPVLSKVWGPLIGAVISIVFVCSIGNVPLAAFYVTMVLAGYAVELIFGGAGIVPTTRNAQVLTATVSWNYTTYLNIVFFALGIALLWRFFRTGGATMLKMMGGAPAPATAEAGG
jgi:hypothetical protein